MAGTGGQPAALDLEEHPLLPSEEGLPNSSTGTDQPVSVSSSWRRGVALTLAGSCLGAIAVILLPFCLSAAQSVFLEGPIRDDEILTRCLSAGLILTPSTMGLVIGIKVLRRGVPAMGGWNSATPLVLCGVWGTLILAPVALDLILRLYH